MGLFALASVWAAEAPLSSSTPRIWVVALDGSGDFRSVQEAIDMARDGDTVRVKAGHYAEDVTVHSKDRLTIIGEGIDAVTILGLNRVGSFHIGKWPYGATNVQISGMTINQHGGLALGIFNGRGVHLHHLRVKGLLFGQQVAEVRIEDCDVGGSETTGVQFANSDAVLVGNLIHDNDHGILAAGTSTLRVERNVITRHLFEGVVVRDSATAVLVRNTIVKNGGGAAFLDHARGEASGNIVGMNTVGFVVAPSSAVTLSHNALFNRDGDYGRPGTPAVPAPELRPTTDLVAVDPRFVDPEKGDYRLRADTPLVRVGNYPFLGALAPEKVSP